MITAKLIVYKYNDSTYLVWFKKYQIWKFAIFFTVFHRKRSSAVDRYRKTFALSVITTCGGTIVKYLLASLYVTDGVMTPKQNSWWKYPNTDHRNAMEMPIITVQNRMKLFNCSWTKCNSCSVFASRYWCHRHLARNQPLRRYSVKTEFDWFQSLRALWEMHIIVVVFCISWSSVTITVTDSCPIVVFWLSCILKTVSPKNILE